MESVIRIHYLLFVLMATKMVSANVDQNKTHCFHQNRILFDLTEFVRAYPNGSKFNNVANSTLSCGSQQSRAFFYETNGNASKDACWFELKIAGVFPVTRKGNKISSSDCIFYAITGISIIFTEKATNKEILNLPGSPMTKDTITDLLKVNSSILDSITVAINDFDCRCTTALKSVTDYLQNKVKILGDENKVFRSSTSVNFGLEYGQRFLECCAPLSVSLLKFVNHTVFRVDVNPFSTLSYQLFSEMIAAPIFKNRNFVHQVNPNCTLYIHLVNSYKGSRVSKESYQQYQFLISKYAQKWTEENSGDEILIVRPAQQKSTVPDSTEHPTTGTNEDSYYNQTKSPIDFKPVVVVDSPNNVFHQYAFYLVIVAVGTPLVVIIFVLCLRLRRSENRFLEQRYISQFYNGMPLQESRRTGESGSSNRSTYHSGPPNSTVMKFPNEYEIRRRNIELQEIIGSGQFGVVHRGRLLPEETLVAVKIPREDCDVEQFKSTLAELKILCYIGSHLNVVRFLGAHTKQIAKGTVYIVTEYCDNGSLQGYLRNMQRRPASNENSSSGGEVFDLNHRLCCFSHQIACGMEYVAGQRVVHGDLAARNVLLTGDYTCKISDFGLSRRLYEMAEYKKSSREPLPWRWMAPESLNSMAFTTQSDVWSYGVTLWEIFSLGKLPYPGMNWTVHFVRELENGMRMEKAQHALHETYIKMLNCWNLNPDKRPTFTEMVGFFAEQRNNVYMSLHE